jgi:hypothetical protein
MPSPIYQNMVDLAVRPPIRKCANKFMNVAMREHRTFGNDIFGCDKFYYSDSIIITNCLYTLILNNRFENVFATYLGIEIP